MSAGAVGGSLPVRVRLLMADGSEVVFEHEVPAGQFVRALELCAGGDLAPVVRVPFVMHGMATLHTVCSLDNPDDVRAVEW